MDTLVLHLDDRTTDFLMVIYAGCGYPVVSGAINPADLADKIKTARRVFLLGHGGPGGLFARNFNINDDFGCLLGEKQEGLYIWCNADAYAVRHALTGLVSGMFISEVAEARLFGITVTQSEVDDSNYFFSSVVRHVLGAGLPLSEVKERYDSAACPIVQFNRERLYVFEHGVPTPALHYSSLAWRRTETVNQIDLVEHNLS